MGVVRSSFNFVVGIFFGIYAAQNYNVPNINKLAATGALMFKHYEESHRKPKKSDYDE